MSEVAQQIKEELEKGFDWAAFGQAALGVFGLLMAFGGYVVCIHSQYNVALNTQGLNESFVDGVTLIGVGVIIAQNAFRAIQKK